MSETNYVSKLPSRLLDVKKQMEHTPLIRTRKFIFSGLAVLALYAILLFSFANITAGSITLIAIAGYVVLCTAFLVIVFSDELIKEWLKTLAVFLWLVNLLYLYYRFSSAQWERMANLFFNLEVIQKALPTLVQGIWVTVKIAIFAAIMSTILGLLLAVFRSLENRVLNIFIVAYVDFFRAMPIMVLMVLIYYALPYLGIRLDAIVSGILALGLNSSAYVSEIFRAGISSVRKGQIEAAHALGLTTMQTMRLILLPQAFRVVMPPLVGNYVASAKDTALCSSISIIELLKAGLSEQALLANPSPLIFSAVMYIVMFVPLTRLSTILENRMKSRQRRSAV